jgi:uncharacterized membrane protein
VGAGVIPVAVRMVLTAEINQKIVLNLRLMNLIMVAAVAMAAATLALLRFFDFRG